MKYFIAFQKTHWTVYTSAYLIRVFVDWKFTNPFQWVVDIPVIGPYQRADLLMAVLGYLITIACISWFVYQVAKEKEAKKLQNH